MIRVRKAWAVPRSVPENLKEEVLGYLTEMGGQQERHVPGWLMGFAGHKRLPWERDLVTLANQVKKHLTKPV